MSDPIVTRWLTRDDLAQKTVSYAQNAEDVLIHRAFGGLEGGLYVDVGANDPVFHSVTRLLYERGWRGVNIEPTPALHARLEADRPGDVNLNLGISDSDGILTFFEVAPPLHGWSTFLPEMAAAYRDSGVIPAERPIPVTTLDRVFERHVPEGRTVDLLKIDVEGLERQVITAFDWRRWRPRVVVAESTWADLWEHVLLGADYRTAAFDGINRYYVRPEDHALIPAFASPANILDNFVPYEYVRLILAEDFDFEVARRLEILRRKDLEDVGPTALSFARWLTRAARRTPRGARVVKRFLRLSA